MWNASLNLTVLRLFITADFGEPLNILGLVYLKVINLAELVTVFYAWLSFYLVIFVCNVLIIVHRTKVN